MITIYKSPNADSRSANSPITPVSLRSDTVSHMKDVDKGIKFICNELEKRAKSHDHTKIEHIDDFCDALNSGKIKESDWYQLHIMEERHHLKSHVPDDVNLIDVIEHLVDCTMAGLARSGEIYDVDLLAETLQLAAQNTVELIKANTQVIDPSVESNHEEELLNDEADPSEETENEENGGNEE